MAFHKSRLFFGALILFAVSSSMVFSNQALAANSCSLDELRSRCEKIWPDLQEEDRKLDQQMKSVDIAGTRRLEDAVVQVKKDIIDEIRKGRADSELSSAEKLSIQKITSVKVLDPNSSFVTEHPACMKHIPNGFYTDTNHTIVMCPRAVNQNEGAMYLTLAHEMTHAIDPCLISNSVYKVRVEMLVQERNKLGITSPFKKSEYNSLIDEVKASGRASLNLSSDHNPAAALFPKAALQLEAKGSDISEYPFRDAYTCLAKPPSSFKTGPPLKNVKNAPDGKSGSGGDVDPLTGTDQCSPDSQMSEVMSDWMGAKILGRYLDRNPPRSDYDRFGALGFYYREICPVPRAEVSLLSKATQSVFSKLGVKSGPADPHAAVSDRVSKVVMTEPSVRRMFECAPTSKSCFAAPAARGSGSGANANSKSKTKPGSTTR